jgi:hypothetical protein
MKNYTVINCAKKPTRMRVELTCENDMFACEIHTPAWRFLNIFLLRPAQFFRTHAKVGFQHARVKFPHA